MARRAVPPGCRPVKVFRYGAGIRSRFAWTWTCSSCGVGHTSPQFGTWDTQPAALSAALRHCRESRLA